MYVFVLSCTFLRISTKAYMFPCILPHYIMVKGLSKHQFTLFHHIILNEYIPSCSFHQLVGNCQKDTRGVVRWKDGILTRLLRQVDTVDSLKTTLKHPDIGPLLQTAVTQV